MARALSLSFFFNKANFFVISPILSVFVSAKLSDWEGSFKGSFLVSTLVSGSYLEANLLQTSLSFILLFLLKYQPAVLFPLYLIH